MVSYLVKECNDCNSVYSAIKSIDHTLGKYGKNKYQNNAYLTSKPFPKDRIKLLIRYKEILENLTWRPDFYAPYFSLFTIISRVKVLTNGL